MPLRPVKHVSVVESLPEDIADRLERILGISMTYDGHLIATAMWVVGSGSCKYETAS